jgi:hypothetical protein
MEVEKIGVSRNSEWVESECAVPRSDTQCSDRFKVSHNTDWEVSQGLSDGHWALLGRWRLVAFDGGRSKLSQRLISWESKSCNRVVGREGSRKVSDMLTDERK